MENAVNGMNHFNIAQKGREGGREGRRGEEERKSILPELCPVPSLPLLRPPSKSVMSSVMKFMSAATREKARE